MSVPTWFVFPCNIQCGPDGDDPPQTEWSGKHDFAYTCSEACGRARRLVNDQEYDLAIIMYYVEGKGLELLGTFGFRPAKNDYDFPGTRADGFVLVRKFCDAVLSTVENTSIQE